MELGKPFFKVPVGKDKKEKRKLFLYSIAITLVIVVGVLVGYYIGYGGSLVLWISILALLYVLIAIYNNKKKK